MEMQSPDRQSLDIVGQDNTTILFATALRDRHDGRYQDAVNKFERIIELDGDSEMLWSELAISQFQLWRHHAITICKPGKNGLYTTHAIPRLASSLQEAYNTFLIAMEYPANKKNPLLLLPLAMIYIEFNSYRGALSVCTLLVEGYSHCEIIGEAIFLSALTAKALGKDRESAQYFQHIVDKPPHRLHSYQLHLLAALEFEKIAGMKDHARESYAQAYKAMISLSPATPSEKAAHAVYKTSRKNENYRIELWYRNDDTWFELARRLEALNFPLLARSALEVVRNRNANFAFDMLVLEGVCLYRTGSQPAAEESFMQALQLSYYSLLVRDLLSELNQDWNAQFDIEIACATHIQRYFTKYVCRKRWRTTLAGLIEDRRCRMAIIIQCAWRSFRARQELQILREERRRREEECNALMAMHDEFVLGKQQNQAAVKIQSLYRRFAARQERKRRIAVQQKYDTLVMLFSNHRGLTAKQRMLKMWKIFVRNQQSERWDAACLLQRQARRYLGRKFFKRLMNARQNQEQMIKLCLGKQAVNVKKDAVCSWKQYIEAVRLEKQQSATRIQRCYRSLLARRRYLHELNRHKIATEIMHRMRMDKAQQMMTAVWDSFLSNAIWHRLQKRKSAILIQKRARGMIGRRYVKKLRSQRRRIEIVVNSMRKKSAAQRVRAVLDALQLNVAMNHEFRDQCALTVQRVFRGFRGRKRVKLIIECDKILQTPGLTLKGKPPAYVIRVCFLVLARLPEQAYHDRLHAAKHVQRWFRFCSRRKKLMTALHKKIRQRAILKRLQADFKSLARLFFMELKTIISMKNLRRNRAAQRIQRAVRRWLVDRRFLHLTDKLHAAKSRTKAYFKQKEDMLQRFALREWMRVVTSDKTEREQAATRIQRMYRTRQAKKHARKIVSKKAIQAQLLASVHLKPLERCFRRWESMLMEKSIFSIRSAANVPILPDEMRKLLGKGTPGALPTIEQRAEIPSILFYTILNRVRKSGICQLCDNAGYTFTVQQLRQLFSLATSIVSDGGGSNNNLCGQLNEQIIEALYGSNNCALQKLFLYNAPIDVAHAVKLSQSLKQGTLSNLVSLVFANIPLRSGAVVAIACVLCQSHCKLEQLVLEDCSIGSIAAVALIEALQTNTRLWKLDLSQNHLTDSICRALGTALCVNETLQVLSLSANALSDRGVLGYLAPALETAGTTSGLQQLVLRQNARITALGASALQQAAIHFTSSASASSRSGRSLVLAVDVS